MTRILVSLAALAALSQLTSAGIVFSTPKAGATLTADTAIEVAWAEGGTGPKIADLLTYQLFLVAGGNDGASQQVLLPITTQGVFAVGNTASGMVGHQAGENTPANAYFLKMIAVAKAGGQFIVYSDRFSYSGMSGAFAPAVKTGAAGISGTAGPDSEDNTVDPAKPAGAAGTAGDYNLAYTLQTGLTRYAPMQPVPPTKITQKNTKPMYPTSSVAIAKTRLPIPKIQTTLTQSQTFSVSSMENTVAAASHPTDDMQKFLNRWKD